jgi:two-component system chemotaxis sensor kinase CheA
MVSLIIEFDGSYFGIVVDRVIGKQETVIKNLGEVLNHLSVYSGGTIFGDGAIGFVVDVEEFLKEAKKIEE